MKLEQHFYTSGKTEFETVAVTEGISRDERIILENHSIYFLPVSLHYQEDITTPVKYMWYPLHEDREDRFVLGKAVYKGKDNLGRTGNYLFHNIVLSKEDLIICCYINPVSLIMALERNGIFQSDVPEHSVQVLDLSSDEIKEPPSDFPDIPRDLLLQIFYVCVHFDAVHQPLLLTGTDKECLEFLERLYALLPYDVRMKLCVDTYAYGVSLGFQILGSLEEEDFRQGLTSSLMLHLATLQSASYFDMPQPSPHLRFMTDMVFAGRFDELDAVYSLEHCLRRGHYERFKSEYGGISSELQAVVWDFHRNIILRRIVNELDTELMLMIQNHLVVKDIGILYAEPKMIHRLIEADNMRNMETVAHWLCTEGAKVLFYPYLFKSHSLWKVLLERIQQYPAEAGFLLEPIHAFQGHYTKEFEETLLEAMLTILPHIKEEKKLAKDFSKAFDTLPELDVQGQSDTHLLLLRIFVKYELSKDSELLEQLVDSNLAVLSKDQQTMVLNSMLAKILIIKSLKIWSPDKVEHQIRRLFQNASGDNALLLSILASIEKLSLSGEARKILKEIFAEIFGNLPEDNTSKQIHYTIDRILKSPSSVIEKITEKIFSLKDL